MRPDFGAGKSGAGRNKEGDETMKLRPQFNLRFRSAEQFELVMGEAAREDISMNEYILRGLEGFYVVLKEQRIAAERAEELNGKEKVAEVAATSA